MIIKENKFFSVDRLKNSDNYFVELENKIAVFDPNWNIVRQCSCENSHQVFSYENFSHYIVGVSNMEIVIIDTKQQCDEVRMPISETDSPCNIIHVCESNEKDTFYLLCEFVRSRLMRRSRDYKLFKVNINENKAEEIFMMEEFPLGSDSHFRITLLGIFFNKRANYIYFKSSISGRHIPMYFDMNKYTESRPPELSVIDISFLKKYSNQISFTALQEGKFYFHDSNKCL